MGSCGTDVTIINSAQLAETLITLIEHPALHAANILSMCLIGEDYFALH